MILFFFDMSSPSLSFYSFANFKKDCLALCIGIAFFQTTLHEQDQVKFEKSFSSIEVGSSKIK